jgi:kynurenine/2-aminoadipate aminotransferase
MLIRPGDAILVENPTYTGALSFIENIDCTIADIATDAWGIVPSSLEDMLANWPAGNPSGRTDQPRPHCLYTVPSGGNPTGVSSTLERKQAIYAICSKYDVLILEDDPYYFLQFNGRIPSYLSMDHEGRVLRLDSMSKVLAAGLRIGWVTGPKELVERINLHTMGTNLQPTGVSQGMAYSLLEKWGHTGFLEHVDRVADFYRERRNDMVACLDKHMVGRGEWAVPDAGMFVWVRLLGSVTDSFTLVFEKLLKENVLVIPGLAFMPQQNKSEYVRISYSSVTKENMNQALKILADVIDAEATGVSELKIE